MKTKVLSTVRILTFFLVFGMIIYGCDNDLTDNTLYTITFNINGATSGTAPQAQTVKSGSSITLPNGSGFLKTGQSFKGWNTSSSGMGSNFNANSSYIVTGNITLFAKWEISTFTVTFDTNGETSGTTPQAQTVNYNSKIILPNDNNFSRIGFAFAGWNTNSSGTGTNYITGFNFTVINNITLYAKWITVPTVFGAYTNSNLIYGSTYFNTTITFNSNSSLSANWSYSIGGPFSGSYIISYDTLNGYFILTATILNVGNNGGAFNTVTKMFEIVNSNSLRLISSNANILCGNNFNRSN